MSSYIKTICFESRKGGLKIPFSTHESPLENISRMPTAEALKVVISQGITLRFLGDLYNCGNESLITKYRVNLLLAIRAIESGNVSMGDGQHGYEQLSVAKNNVCILLRDIFGGTVQPIERYGAADAFVNQAITELFIGEPIIGEWLQTMYMLYTSRGTGRSVKLPNTYVVGRNVIVGLHRKSHLIANIQFDRVKPKMNTFDSLNWNGAPISSIILYLLHSSRVISSGFVTSAMVDKNRLYDKAKSEYYMSLTKSNLVNILCSILPRTLRGASMGLGDKMLLRRIGAMDCENSYLTRLIEQIVSKSCPEDCNVNGLRSKIESIIVNSNKNGDIGTEAEEIAVAEDGEADADTGAEEPAEDGTDTPEDSDAETSDETSDEDDTAGDDNTSDSEDGDGEEATDDSTDEESDTNTPKERINCSDKTGIEIKIAGKTTLDEFLYRREVETIITAALNNPKDLSTQQINLLTKIKTTWLELLDIATISELLSTLKLPKLEKELL